MEDFQFIQQPQCAQPVFLGYRFYNVYQTADFLNEIENIDLIFSNATRMKFQGKAGTILKMGNMMIRPNLPLTVKVTGLNVTIDEYEFTANRLTGFVAAYIFDHRLESRFCNISLTEAEDIGLNWSISDTEKCKLYLSAVTGAEHFSDQFSFWPLVCALRKFQQGKITNKNVIVKIARKKNRNNVRFAKEFKDNYDSVQRLWTYFPGASIAELQSLRASLPAEIIRALESE